LAIDLQDYRYNYYAPVVFTSPRKYYLADKKSLREVVSQIVSHAPRQEEYKTLEKYHRNITKINTRVFDDDTKPNNRIGHPFAEVIVNTATSYFTGEPIQVLFDNKDREKDLKRIHYFNDVDDVNSELDRLSNLYGHAYEFHWREKVQGKPLPRFIPLSPLNCIVFHSMEIDEKPIAAVVWSERVDEATKIKHFSVTLYDEVTATKFSFTLNGASEADIGPGVDEAHGVGYLPVIEYLNNEDRASSFEKVIPLIDSYNVAISDTINDVEYWADSYMVLTNMTGTDSEDIARMKANRVMLIDGDGKAEFLQKNTNDRHLENIKNRLTQDIHKFAQVPNLHDEQFATNLSGVAIRMKIKDLEDKTSAKERKFEKSLRKRYEIIFNFLDKVSLDKTDDFVTFVFTRNIPTNLVEIAEMVSKAPEGLFSYKTLRTMFPMVRYVEAEEVKQIEKEAEEKMSAEAGANPFKANPLQPPQGKEVAQPPKPTEKTPPPTK